MNSVIVTSPQKRPSIDKKNTQRGPGERPQPGPDGGYHAEGQAPELLHIAETQSRWADGLLIVELMSEITPSWSGVSVSFLVPTRALVAQGLAAAQVSVMALDTFSSRRGFSARHNSNLPQVNSS